MKPIEEMNQSEVEAELFSLDFYFLRCEAAGDGINTKDVVRFRALSERLVNVFREDLFSQYHECQVSAKLLADKAADKQNSEVLLSVHAKRLVREHGMSNEEVIRYVQMCLDEQAVFIPRRA